jgi:hypothetical protein
VEVLKDFVLGDTIARYMQPGLGGPVGMMLIPAAMAGQVAEKSSAIDSLVQIKTVGDTYPGHSAGRSLRNGGTVATLTLESQLEVTTDAGVTVVTLLRTHQGCLVEHHLRWRSGEAALDSFAVLRNEGPDTVTLELLSSFSLTGLTPFAGDDDAAHRLTARHQLFLDVPAVEEALPVIFNEYCTTWGSPSPQNLGAIVDRLAGKGIRYLVIDSGWYKAEGSEWFNGQPPVRSR